jgi:hypothetical protein
VRGAEALDMLKAWNTGHPGGIATVHANSALSALYRVEQLVQEAVVSVPRPLIADAIDLIVFIAGRGLARRVQTIARVVGLDPDGGYGLIDITPKPNPNLSSKETNHACACPEYPRSPFLPVRRRLHRHRHHHREQGSRRRHRHAGATASAGARSCSGPVAKIMAVAVIVLTGLTLAFGETAGGFRRLIQIIFGLSIAFAASSFFLSFFSFGGGALIA